MFRGRSEIFLTFQKSFIFISLIIILDWCIGNGLQYLYFKQKTGPDARMIYGLESTTADILILGSSSANHHYIPAIFKEVLNLNAYNLGRDGIDILYSDALMKSILLRYTPKVIVLNLTPNELTANLGYDRLSVLLPLCEKYPEMREKVLLKGKAEKLKMLSQIYPYNSSLLTIIGGQFHNDEETNIDNGYVPRYNCLDTTKLKSQFIVSYTVLDTNRIAALNEILNLCKERSIAIYVFMSPVFKYDSKESVSIKKIMEISGSKGISFVSYIKDDRFKGNPMLFQDNGHMNHSGAQSYSKIVADHIQEDVKNKKLVIN